MVEGLSSVGVQVLIKTRGLQNVGELKLCVEEGVVLFWMESCRPMVFRG